MSEPTIRSGGTGQSEVTALGQFQIKYDFVESVTETVKNST